jgi:hypothetical protein
MVDILAQRRTSTRLCLTVSDAGRLSGAGVGSDATGVHHRVGPAFRGRSGAGLGETLDAAPHAGLAQGRTSDAKTGSILRSGVKEMSAPNSKPISRLFNRRSTPPHFR